jgi:hypothetical protein
LTRKHPLRMICWVGVAENRGRISRRQRAQPCDGRLHGRDPLASGLLHAPPEEKLFHGGSLLTRAIEEARVLVTRDIGLGGLALRRLEQGVSLGVVLVRLPAEMASGDAAATVDAALRLAGLPNDGLGVFAVISLNNVRVRIVVRRAPTE